MRIPSLSPIAVATALELGAKNVFPTVDLVNQAGNGGRRHDRGNQHPVEIRDAVRLVDWSWVVLAGIPDSDTYAFRSDARRRGFKIKFVRRMGDDFPRHRPRVVGPRE